MLLRDQNINEEYSQKQIGPTLKITEQTLCILENLQKELSNYQLQSLEYLKRLIVIQISDLQNKQQQYNLFLSEVNKEILNIVELQSNELLQLNTSIRLQLKEELFSCGQYINSDYLNKLFQELKQSDESNGKKEIKYQYRKLLQLKIDKSKFCYNYAFNTNSTVVFTGNQDGKIRVHGFNCIYKLIQTFSDKNFQEEFVWIKQTKSLVVGCQDESIVIWYHYWNSYQKLEGHTIKISCLILNRKEDLLISGVLIKQQNFGKIPILFGHSNKHKQIIFSSQNSNYQSLSEISIVYILFLWNSNLFYYYNVCKFHIWIPQSESTNAKRIPDLDYRTKDIYVNSGILSIFVNQYSYQHQYIFTVPSFASEINNQFVLIPQILFRSLKNQNKSYFAHLNYY